MKILVKVREVHIQDVLVEVPNDTKHPFAVAKQKVADAQGKVIDNALEYSHTLDPETFTCEDVTFQPPYSGMEVGE